MQKILIKILSNEVWKVVRTLESPASFSRQSPANRALKSFLELKNHSSSLKLIPQRVSVYPQYYVNTCNYFTLVASLELERKGKFELVRTRATLWLASKQTDAVRSLVGMSKHEHPTLYLQLIRIIQFLENESCFFHIFQYRDAVFSFYPSFIPYLLFCFRLCDPTLRAKPTVKASTTKTGNFISMFL